MFPFVVGVLSLVLVLSSVVPAQVPAAARADLAPKGKLRVGINLANTLITMKDPAGGDPRGVPVDLARELARRLGVPVEFIGYDAPGKVAAAAKTGGWDVGFIAIEPERAKDIAFSPAYLQIEATYLVRESSPLRSLAEVDRDGIRIAVSATSAYDLFLTRTLKHAQLVRAQGSPAASQLLADGKVDALAGLRPLLQNDADKLPGSRLLDGGFTAVGQAIGTPKGRDAGARYLRVFVEEIKASGFVAQVIKKNGVRGVSVAPKATD